MRVLSNENLLDAYHKAIELKLEKAFIQLLLDEIRRRNIHIGSRFYSA